MSNLMFQAPVPSRMPNRRVYVGARVEFFMHTIDLVSRDVLSFNDQRNTVCLDSAKS